MITADNILPDVSQFWDFTPIFFRRPFVQAYTVKRVFLLSLTMTSVEVGEVLDVNPDTVTSIIRGDSYSHIIIDRPDLCGPELVKAVRAASARRKVAPSGSITGEVGERRRMIILQVQKHESYFPVTSSPNIRIK